ncbi:MAG TPA: glycosyltransferase family 39 protein [Thermoanaerobaculia bacterium]|nr:glycosyltransferase family 39 protein [Thermoanaerobaculia bacterium]
MFRLPGLETVPPGLYIDEAQEGVDGWSIATGQSFPVWVLLPGTEELRGREAGYQWALAIVFRFAGPSVFALRLTSALIGIATVGVFFLVCQRLIGYRFATIAGILMAVSRWHSTFSRTGFRAILVPLFMMLALLFFVEMVRQRSPRMAAAFGLVLGLGFYTYPSWWVMPFAFALVGLALLIRAPGKERIGWIGLTAVACPFFALALAPLAGYTILHPERVFARPAETLELGQGGDGPVLDLIDNTQRVILMLHLRGDREARHNNPGQPMLDPFSGAAFLAGLAWTLRRTVRGDPIWTGALLLWLITLLPSIATDSAPHAMRAIAAIPPVIFLAAAGVDLLWKIPSLSERGRRGIALAVVLAAMLWNGQALLRWGRDPDVAWHFDADIPRYFDLMAELTDDHDVLISPSLDDSPHFRFLRLEKRPRFVMIRDTTFLTGPAKRDRVIASESPELNLLVETIYPEVELISRFPTYGGPKGRIYRIPRQRLRTSLGSHEVPVADHLFRRALERFEEESATW